MYDGSQRTASPPTSASRQFVCQSGVWYCRTPTPRSTGTRAPWAGDATRASLLAAAGRMRSGPYNRGVPRSTVCLSFDFDAMSVWFEYERVTPAMLQRGEFGARVGVPRILTFLRERDLPATFFVPGHTVESFPDETASILEAGHEVAHHSYAHVDPSGQARDEERADMERAWKTLEGIGVTPLGFRSPSADLSASTLELIEEFGFVYDSSLTTDDYRPFRPRIGDRVSRQTPLERGREARFWELPFAFELDDWPYFSSTSSPTGTAELRRARCSRTGRASSTGCTSTRTAGF